MMAKASFSSRISGAEGEKAPGRHYMKADGMYKLLLPLFEKTSSVVLWRLCFCI